MSAVYITTFKYDSMARRLKLFYSDGRGVLFCSVPALLHQNLLKSQDKTAFVRKYLEYDLQFSRITIY
ncbi:KTSC domain-containing protein [Acinetobacter qingfengensis]|uniref:KTSC domain-containing protein n=1 Tax=Acinetobacter qingfengensis TaxID=1262585 RepID=A0A1E7RAN4_9GAMM|nr:KTSC domain-containing protein [Acinetobacter qingfengensis]KAA8734796.1 KTSC domain-containing protein [Acinetobacter qingfengensis]OEY96424.1 KTSC domain-containing protein [Acinetobacter qingfengensis]